MVQGRRQGRQQRRRREAHLQAQDEERARARRGLDALWGHGNVTAVVVVGLVQHLVQPLDDVSNARHDRGVRALIAGRARPCGPTTSSRSVRLVVKDKRLRRSCERRLCLLPRALLSLLLLLLALARDLGLELLALAREGRELALALVPRHRAPPPVLRYLGRQGGGAGGGAPLALRPVHWPRGGRRGQRAGQLRGSRGRGHRVLVGLLLLLLVAAISLQWSCFCRRCCWLGSLSFGSISIRA